MRDDLKELVGSHVLSAEIDRNNDYVVLTTKDGKYHLTWEGDCCSSCYLAQVSGSENLIGATIEEVYSKEWEIKRDGGEYGDVIESMGTTLRTTKGYVDLETRLEHNGYYGGTIYITKDDPTYSGIQLRPLTDF